MLTLADFRRDLGRLVERGHAARLDRAEMAAALEDAVVDAERIVAVEDDAGRPVPPHRTGPSLPTATADDFRRDLGMAPAGGEQNTSGGANRRRP